MRTLEITTRIGCTNNCPYCPQGVLLRAYEGRTIMRTKHFKMILLHTPKDVQIDFAGFCEPFLNPWASWMIYHAVSLGYQVVLDTTLTGFCRKDADILKGVHLKQVFVHKFPGFRNDNLELLKSSVTADKFEVSKLPKEFRLSRAGNLWERHKQMGRFECGWNKDFTRNVVLPNCDVYLCCMDYGLKHKIGNLYVNTYDQLNRGFIKSLADCDNSMCICRECEIMKKI